MPEKAGDRARRRQDRADRLARAVVAAQQLFTAPFPTARAKHRCGTPWLLLAASTHALIHLTNKSFGAFVRTTHAVTLLRVCAERCASDAALDAIDIEGVGVAATTRDIGAVREFDAELLLVYGPNSRGRPRTCRDNPRAAVGRVLGGRAYDDMVWWLRRSRRREGSVQDERLEFRPGLFALMMLGASGRCAWATK